MSIELLKEQIVENKITQHPFEDDVRGYKKLFFPAEIRKEISVNRLAIEYNLIENKKAQTCILKLLDENRNIHIHYCHRIVLHGPAILMDIGTASIRLITYGAVEGYVDEAHNIIIPTNC